MTGGDRTPTEADRRYREWMRDNLTGAARHFGVVLDGEPVFGWLDRSISAPARRDDQQFWLRVLSELSDWAHGHAWTGNFDASTLLRIPKPRVLDIHVWTDNPHRHVRAELMTRMPGNSCSPTNVPPPHLTLPESWWSRLRASLDDLARTPTERVNVDQAKVDQRVHAAFGDDVTVTIRRWETVHGDLHWNNLFRDPFGIVDWELWGTGPVGSDAATLYLYSLAEPPVAAAVHSRFADVLDTPDGRQAQIYVVARLLHRATFGDHPELVTPLHEYSRRLLAA